MNTLVIVLIAAVVLVCAYAGYGRWLAKTWGVDPNAKTPAVRLEDGKDYVPTNGWTVFALSLIHIYAAPRRHRRGGAAAESAAALFESVDTGNQLYGQ